MRDPVLVAEDESGVPLALTWRNGRYRILDAVLLSDLFQPTHPLPFDGYRVSVVNEIGWRYELDLRQDRRVDGDGSRWELVGVSAPAGGGV